MTSTVEQHQPGSGASSKVNLLGLSPVQMEAFFTEIGEKPFRAQQIMKWIHHLGVDDFDTMSNISKSLRELLKEKAEIRAPEVVSQMESADGTRKWVLRVDGGQPRAVHRWHAVSCSSASCAACCGGSA